MFLYVAKTCTISEKNNRGKPLQFGVIQTQTRMNISFANRYTAKISKFVSITTEWKNPQKIAHKKLCNRLNW